TIRPATFVEPKGVTVDGEGNVIVADSRNHTICRITLDGVSTILAGSANNPGYRDETGTAAQFNTPKSVGVDTNGNVYVGDSGNFVNRKITSDGIVTTPCGSPMVPGAADGTGASARFGNPEGVA